VIILVRKSLLTIIELGRKKLEIFYNHFLIYIMNNDVIYHINEKMFIKRSFGHL